MAEAKAPELSASLEDYLEAIFWIVRQKQAARAKDIGERLNVGRSSVTGALRALAERALVNYAPYDLITLTEAGRTVAEDVVRRHEVLRDFFVNVLAVGMDDAEAAACRMEHAIPEAVLQRFLEFAELMDRCPRCGAGRTKGLGYWCEKALTVENCEKCVESVLEEVRRKKMTSDEQAAVTLASLKPGDKAFIVKISGSGGIRRRLLDMGATARTEVQVERVAPLGDPIEVKIKGYHLTLRKEEAGRITVERASE